MESAKQYTAATKRLYIRCRANALYFRISRKIHKKLGIPTKQTTRRYGIPLMEIEETQQKMADRIRSDQPFMAGRIGGVEGNVCLFAAGVEMGLKKRIPEEWIRKAEINAGFFPSDEENLLKFWDLMRESYNEVDILGSMQINSEEFMIRSASNQNVLLTNIRNLEPYYAENPWTQALKGKKVLVIHPFADTILSQYEKRRLIYPDEKYLPDFQLTVVKAVQSIAGEKTAFDNWFDALDYMTGEALRKEFDVAIIGCGAYGFPLAARLKKAGKQVIHLGGAVQIMFGIIGARWYAVPEVKRLFNENWVHPSTEEMPKNAKSVEGACYW